MYSEIPYQDPAVLFSQIALHKKYPVFLDSALLREHAGQYSFIAFDPFLIISSKNGQVKVGEKCIAGDPFLILAEELKKHVVETVPDLPPFQGGAVGFFGYDLCHHLEVLPRTKIDDMEFLDMWVGFYDVVFAFDHEKEKAWVFSINSSSRGLSAGSSDKDSDEDRSGSRGQAAGRRVDIAGRVDDTYLEENFTSKEYQASVQKVIDYILAGDIFQANLTQRFLAELPPDIDPFDLYLTLRAINPAPFAAYLALGDTVIASASPERFLKLTQGEVETRPIKGTRARGKNPLEDKKLAEELLASDKDHAENTMIVDLLRNDLSKVCRDHSVSVPQLCALESYATVHHLVSVVKGTLRSGLTAIDLLRATFPGGSITGAPKIRAMEIISELEPTARGPYCGSIGYIGFNGDMDLSITIRTFCIKNNKITFQAGGGIVLQSDPLLEYEEMLSKVKALKKALKQTLSVA